MNKSSILVILYPDIYNRWKGHKASIDAVCRWAAMYNGAPDSPFAGDFIKDILFVGTDLEFYAAKGEIGTFIFGHKKTSGFVEYGKVKIYS